MNAAAVLRGMAPWLDRKGRVHPLRAVVFTLLLLPGAWLAARWGADMLGARPLNKLIHGTGYWAAWLLLASLVVSPAKAVLSMPNLVVVRRMVGNAALAYAAVHLLLYITDQNWRLLHVGAEIVLRFYLTIGFAALVGLVALGVTSTDGWARRLGAGWKRLHRIAYGIAVLAMFHFFLQSKQDVSAALVAAGVYFWLMLWRRLPAGRDRAALPLLGVAVGTAALTLLAEYAWYRLATHADPLRVVRSEFDWEYGLRPAGQVLALGLLVASAVQLRAVAYRFGTGPAFTMLVYALGALADDALSFVWGTYADDDSPELMQRVLTDLVWMGLFAVLGLVRWRLRYSKLRFVVDAAWLAASLLHVVFVGMGSRGFGAAVAAVGGAGWYLLTRRVWTVSRGAALALVPLGMALAYEAATLL